MCLGAMFKLDDEGKKLNLAATAVYSAPVRADADNALASPLTPNQSSPIN